MADFSHHLNLKWSEILFYGESKDGVRVSSSTMTLLRTLTDFSALEPTELLPLLLLSDICYGAACKRLKILLPFDAFFLAPASAYLLVAGVESDVIMLGSSSSSTFDNSSCSSFLHLCCLIEGVGELKGVFSESLKTSYASLTSISFSSE